MTGHCEPRGDPGPLGLPPGAGYDVRFGSRGVESAAPGDSAREPARSATSAASAFGASFAVATGCSGSSSCSEPRPLLKLLIAWPRLLPSCGSFEGPKKSNASASTTTISPTPSLIRASTARVQRRPATPRAGAYLRPPQQCHRFMATRTPPARLV